MAAWPEVMRTEAISTVDDGLKRTTLHQMLERVCFIAMDDPWDNWLCIIDEVVSRFPTFPPKQWPLELHFLVLHNNFDTQDCEMLVCTVDNMKERKLDLKPDFTKRLDHFCDMLRLRATLLAATHSKIATVEELSQCISGSVNTSSEIAPEMIERIDESNFNIEEAAILAERSLRTFAGKVQKIAFFHSPSQADEILMPETKHLLEAAKSVEAEFPAKWIRLAIKKLADDLQNSRGEHAGSSPAEEAKDSRGEVANGVELPKGKRKHQDPKDPRPVVRLRGKTNKGLKMS